jgi:hypothetical protein
MGCDRAPWQKFCDAVDWIICNSGDDGVEIVFRLYAAQLAGFDKQVGGGGPLPTDI